MIRIVLLSCSAVSLLVGCTEECESLDQVEVEGPPGAARQALPGALDDFAIWTDLPICLRKAKVARVTGDRARYNPTNQSIVVDPDRTAPRDAALHELCHAADQQNDLVHGVIEQYAAVGSHGGTQRRRTKEGFAEVCAVGAATMSMALDWSCPDESVDRLWERTRNAVYGGHSGIGVAEIVPVASWTPPIPSDHSLTLWECAPDQSGNLAIMVQDDVTGEYIRQRLDLTSGTELDGTPVTQTTVWDTSVPAPRHWEMFAAASDQKGVIMWAQLLRPDAPRLVRLLAEANGEWSVADACFSERHECLFVMDSDVYRGVEVDGTVHWGRVERHDLEL